MSLPSWVCTSWKNMPKGCSSSPLFMLSFNRMLPFSVSFQLLRFCSILASIDRSVAGATGMVPCFFSLIFFGLQQTLNQTDLRLQTFNLQLSEFASISSAAVSNSRRVFSRLTRRITTNSLDKAFLTGSTGSTIFRSL